MIPAPTEVVTGAQILACRQPFAYALRRDGKIIYVGATRRGLLRILEPGHRAIRDAGGIQPTDELLIWRGSGLALERALIAEHRPTLNVGDHQPRECRTCQRTFLPIWKVQMYCGDLCREMRPASASRETSPGGAA